MEQKRLLTHFSQLAREQENEFQVALTLVQLSSANLALGLHEEGTQQAKEALEFFERFGNTIGQAVCWDTLARLLHSEGQLDAAEKAASHIRSTPSQGKAKNSSSVNLIEASAKCTGPSARARMRFTISRKPSELRPPSDGTMNYPAFITPPWLFSFFHCPTTLRRSASRNGQLHIFDVVFDFLFAFVVCGPSIFFRRPGCLIWSST